MTHDHSPRDRGSALPLVLAMTMVLGVVVAALANYVLVGLKFGTVVEERADRLAAADGGLRYGIERLTLQSYAACITGLGTSGYTIDFPVDVNGAEVAVTCTKAGNQVPDVQGWAIIVTGEGVPKGQHQLTSQAGGGKQKLLGGPVFINDPSDLDLQSPVTIDDGDIWYPSPTGTCPTTPLTTPSDLSFTPEFRGLLCVEADWDVLFKEPVITNLPTSPAPPPTVDSQGCQVFAPGKYTSLPALSSQVYFRSGEYYFENMVLNPQNSTIVAGWADDVLYGDQQFLPTPKCASAIAADKASGSAAGATLYLGGSSRIEIGNKGGLEILRRKQGNNLVSVQALSTSGPGYVASTMNFNDSLLTTANGNNHDMVIHGLAWAPRARLEFGTVTNSANGQLLGGAVFAKIALKASASASGFIIRVEPTDQAHTLLLEATATKNGRSTTMRAIVQVDDVGITATNSWRVAED